MTALCGSIDNSTDTIGTFSIAAYDPDVEELGVAVQSKFLAVGGVVPFAESGSGAIATQAWGNTSYGTEGLILLEMGISPEKVIDILTAKDDGRDFRQIGIVDANGNSSGYTGDKCSPYAGHHAG
ncbi:DUF1028 domain-containing protein, partial [bacterium]|nr:DUF1028 domain-containing protein [candidate division CSSED10-310 bacterium]